MRPRRDARELLQLNSAESSTTKLSKINPDTLCRVTYSRNSPPTCQQAGNKILREAAPPPA
jgi:hypothetical protein